MAASVGSLFVSLTADAGPLRGGLQLAARDVTAFEARAGRSARATAAAYDRSFTGIRQAASIAMTALSGFGAGLLGGIVGAGTLGQMRNLTREIAAIGDEARRAGISVQDFQRLKFVGSQNRIEIDSLVDGLKELSLRADEFVTTGSGSAAEALKRLGYNATQLREKLKDPADLFVDVIDRIHKLGDTAAGIRIADEVFGGTGGEKFVQLIDQGAEGIRRTMREADALGLVLDEKIVKKATEVDRKFDAIANTIATGVQSEITKSVEAMDSLIDRFRNVDDQSSDNVLRRLQEVYAARQAVQAEVARAREALAADPGNVILGADVAAAEQRLAGLTSHTELAEFRPVVGALAREERPTGRRPEGRNLVKSRRVGTLRDGYQALALRDILDRREGYGRPYDEAGIAAAGATPKVAGLGAAVAAANAPLRDAAALAKSYADALRALQQAGPAATSQAAADAAARDAINRSYTDAIANARSIGDQLRAEAARNAALAEQDRRERERQATEGFGGSVPTPTPNPARGLDETPFQSLANGARDDLAALEVERAAMGMTAREADVLRRSFELLNRARQDGIALSPEQEAELRGIAAAQASVAEATRQATEAQARQEAAIADTRAIARDVFGSFVADLREGKSAVDALSDAMQRLADRLLDRALDSLVDSIFPAPRAGTGSTATTTAPSAASAVTSAVAATAPPPTRLEAVQALEAQAAAKVRGALAAGRPTTAMPERGGAFSTLQGLGFDSVHSAALMGHIQQESGLNPTAFNKREGAFGLLQWRADRLEELKRFAAERGLDYRSADTQLQFIPHEMRTNEARSSGRFLNATDLQGASAGLRDYIRFGDNTAGTRLANAQGYYSQFAGATADAAAVAPVAREAAGALQQVAEQGKMAGTSLADIAKSATEGIGTAARAGSAPNMPLNIGPNGPAAGAKGAPLDLAKLMGGIDWGSIFSDLIQSGASGLGFGLGSLLAQWIFGGEHHDGGTAGTSSVRRPIPTAMLRARSGQKMLRSNEIAAVLERGEKVLNHRQWNSAVDIMSGVAGQPGSMSNKMFSYRAGDFIVQGNVIDDTMPKVRQEIAASERRIKLDIERNLHVYNSKNRDRN